VIEMGYWKYLRKYIRDYKLEYPLLKFLIIGIGGMILGISFVITVGVYLIGMPYVLLLIPICIFFGITWVRYNEEIYDS